MWAVSGRGLLMRIIPYIVRTRAGVWAGEGGEAVKEREAFIVLAAALQDLFGWLRIHAPYSAVMSSVHMFCSWFVRVTRSCVVRTLEPQIMKLGRTLVIGDW